MDTRRAIDADARAEQAAQHQRAVDAAFDRVEAATHRVEDVQRQAREAVSEAARARAGEVQALVEAIAAKNGKSRGAQAEAAKLMGIERATLSTILKARTDQV